MQTTTAAQTLVDPFLDMDALSPEVQTVLDVGGWPLLQQLVALYLRGGPMRWSAIDAAVAEGNLTALRHAVHTLKANSGQLGATAVQSAAAAAEAAAGAGQFEAACAAIEQARAAYAVAAQWMQRVVDTNPGPTGHGT